jgi:hypothetical protein
MAYPAVLEDLLLPNPQEVEYADPLAGTAKRRPVANVVHKRALYPVQGSRPANRRSGRSGGRMLACPFVIHTRITHIR